MPQCPFSMDSSGRCFIQFTEVSANQASDASLTFLLVFPLSHCQFPYFPLELPPISKSCLRPLFLDNQPRYLKKQIFMNHSKVCPCDALLVTVSKCCGSQNSGPVGSGTLVSFMETDACIDLDVWGVLVRWRSIISGERILSKVAEVGMSVATAQYSEEPTCIRMEASVIQVGG